MKKLVLFASLMLFACGSLADIYKWTDSQGNTHFSDVPHDGAEKMNLPDVQGFSPPNSNTGRSSGSGSSEPAKNKESGEAQRLEYTKIEITQPLDQATIRNNQGFVSVTVDIEPGLFEQDGVQIIYDGSPIGEPQRALTFQLNGIYRGSHTVAVQIVDPDGKVLMTSNPITIFMHRPRVGLGNASKHPVKPSGN